MSSVFFELVVPSLWLPPWYVFFFYMSPHYDLSSHNLCNVFQFFLYYLIYVFVSITCLILCGTNNTLLASVIVVPSSHNIVASLCCNVDRFIPTIAILKYDYELALNIVVQKLYMVGNFKP